MDDGADGNGSVLAPDIGGTRLAAGVVDAAGNTHSFVVEPSRTELGVDTVLADLFALGRRAVTESGVSWTDVGAVGIGCGGPPPPESGGGPPAPPLPRRARAARGAPAP